MNFENYKNPLPYPVQILNKPKPLTSDDIDEFHAFRKALKEYQFKIEEYKKKKKAYQDREKIIFECFKKDLFNELGIADNPKKDLLFSKAWEISHSYGYNEVFSTAEDLVELIT